MQGCINSYETVQRKYKRLLFWDGNLMWGLCKQLAWGTGADKGGLELYCMPLRALVKACPGCFPAMSQVREVFLAVDDKCNIFKGAKNRFQVATAVADRWRSYRCPIDLVHSHVSSSRRVKGKNIVFRKVLSHHMESLSCNIKQNMIVYIN